LVGIGAVLALLSGAVGCGPAFPPPESARDLPRYSESISRYTTDDYAEESDESKSLSYDQLRSTFEGALPGDTLSFIRHEPRLDRVAALIALARVWDYKLPVSSLIRWYLWKEGCIVQYAGYVTWSAAGSEGATTLSNALVEYAATEVHTTEPLSYGIYQFHSTEDPRIVWGQAVVFGRRLVGMKPLRKRYLPGDPLDIELRFLDDYTDPQLYVDDVGGGALEWPIPRLSTERDTNSSARVPSKPVYALRRQVPAQPGRYFIEVTAREPFRAGTEPDNQWRRSVLWVPIYVGVNEPTAPDDFIKAPSDNPEIGQWIPTILAAYDKARRDFKLAPLRHHPGLEGLAQSRSRKAGDEELEPPPDSELGSKILGLGLPANKYYQTQGTFEFLSEHIKLSLMRPATRFHLMSNGAPWIGIGIAPKEPEKHQKHDSVTESAIIEYTVQPVAKIDDEDVKRRILEGFDATRKSARLGVYQRDPKLSAAAQAFAGRVCKGTQRPDETNKAWDGVDATVKGVKGNGSVYLTSYDISEADIERIRTKIDAAATRVGVGVCQGDLPGRPQATYIVLLYGGASR